MTPPPGGRRRFALLWAAPVMLVLALAVAPLAGGGRTLFLRDVFRTHLPMKWAQAVALEEGRWPLVDPYRAGGQPLAGNPNAVPFYPDNLLYLVSPKPWAFNAHFWLHLLLAPWGMYALGRSWGLSRRGAWAAGVCYGTSGFFLSQLSFYNLVAGAALAPAFAAACLRAARGGGGRWAPAAGGLWALLLTAGDPMTAALALLLAFTALPAASPSPARRGAAEAGGAWRLAAGLVSGTLVAAPQLVEFLRVLPGSLRGARGYSEASRLAASWDPRMAVEWLVPLAFGRPDRLAEGGGYWGWRFFGIEGSATPLFFTLYPGLLALGLVAAAGWRGRRARWAWGIAAAGLFFALGRFNPLAAWVFGLPGMEMLRYPVKLWLAVAVGAALLAGLGFERALVVGEEGARRRLLGGLLGLAGALLATGLGVLVSGRELTRALLPAELPAAAAEAERLRWLGLVAASLLLVAIYVTLLWRRLRWPAGPSLLLVVHATGQLVLLAPVMATDAAAAYREPPPLLAAVPESARLVHAAGGTLLGGRPATAGSYPAPEVRWLARRAFAELYPLTGPLWGRRYELNPSPEGLDALLTRAARDAAAQQGDEGALRLLAAWGVTHALTYRPLHGAPGQARLVRRRESFGGEIRLYELPRTAPEVYLARRVHRAPDPRAALALLLAPEFDPAADVVVPGEGSAVAGAGGEVRVVESAPEALEVRVRARGPAVLVWQRAHLFLYRAAVDGASAPVWPANLHRVAVPVPAGEHRVRVAVARRPLHLSLLLAVVGLLGWGALAIRPSSAGGKG